jgi:hypothetical protein
MDRRGNWTRALAVGTAVLVALAVTLPAPGARADVAFRKKKAPAASSEAAPTGGELEGASATEAGEGTAAPAAPKTDYVPQVEDKDRPRDPTLIDKPADAVVAKQAPKDEGPAWYSKWQTWAVVGGVAVGLALVIVGGSLALHSAGGGDVRACNNTAFLTCAGQGR